MCNHKSLTRLLGGLVFLWFAAGFVGCATEPRFVQEQDYERADARQVIIDRFNAERRHCQARGGHMVLTMGGSGKIDRRTMQLAYCETRPGVFY